MELKYGTYELDKREQMGCVVVECGLFLRIDGAILKKFNAMEFLLEWN